MARIVSVIEDLESKDTATYSKKGVNYTKRFHDCQVIVDIPEKELQKFDNADERKQTAFMETLPPKREFVRTRGGGRFTFTIPASEHHTPETAGAFALEKVQQAFSKL